MNNWITDMLVGLGTIAVVIAILCGAAMIASELGESDKECRSGAQHNER